MKSLIIIISLVAVALAASCSSGSGSLDTTATTDTLPAMMPDYSGHPRLPRNIAPPRFRVTEEGIDVRAAIALEGSDPAMIIDGDSDGAINIPEKEWAALLDRAAGSSVTLTLATRRPGGEWTAHPAMKFDIDTAALTDWLVYRLIYPGYELWSDMGIYQRCPYTYEQEALLENADAERQCLNCHSFAAGHASDMMLHVRGPKGGTVIARADAADCVKVKPKADASPHGAAYPAWHPSGRYIAFAADEIQQFFHTSGPKTTEVVNLAGDMIVYDTAADRAFTDSLMAGLGYIETFPTWSPDGRMLYYCRSLPIYGPSGIDSARYDLVRRPFDPATGRFTGAPEMVYEASADSLSVTVPRISPDGRWLLLTRARYGNFMIWHDDADLCLIDLADPAFPVRPVDEVNAPGAIDSYHSWSTDGRWMVFSSKRIDGLFARPYIARFDAATGRFQPPFVLPQESATHYDDLLRSFNIPEFVDGRVPHAAALRAAALR